MDPVLELYDPAGGLYAMNDDAVAGSVDASLLVSLPATGTWSVAVRNAALNRNGGPGFSYRALFKVVTVSGQAFEFPNTSEGSSPDPACYAIPDSAGVFVDGPTVACTVDVSGVPPTVSDVNLAVDITHTYASDLRLELQAPGGRRILLTNHTGRIRGIFDADTRIDDPVSTMDAYFDGIDPNGTWTFFATDWYYFDTGTIRRLALFVAP
jgi:hypothetical protein